MDSKGLQELTDIYLKEISADTALRASKEADKARGKAAAGGDREKAKAKAAQASRLYQASAAKRKKEPVATPDRSYPKGKGASYQEEVEAVEEGKKAKKDYDGDGKIESGTDEYLGSKDKAIKKAMKKESHEKVTALRGLVEKKKEGYKTVAAVIDYDRSKKGTDDATYDSEHGEDEKAKKERDYAAFERGKMKKDDPNWKHKKGSTSESMQHRRNPEGSVKDRFKSTQTDPSKDGFTGIGDSIEDIMKQNAAMKKAAAKKTKKEELESTGKFTAEEIDAILEAERSIASRLERKRKLYDKTTKKAMRDAMETGEASGHNRYRMSSINTEYEKLKAKQK